MESIDDATELGAGRSCGQFVSWSMGSINFWSEAKRGARRITSKKLKSVRYNEKAKTLAQTVWDKMTPEHCDVIVEIDRIMTLNGEIGVVQLKETLGQILDSVDVNANDLRAVHSAPIEALTYLLNQMIAIYNRRDAAHKFPPFVPVSTRIEKLLVKAKEMGLGNIEVPSNKYVSDREKLAMIEKQIAGKLKLSGLKTQERDKKKLETLKIEEIKKRRNKLAANREKMRSKQHAKGNRSKVIANYNIIESTTICPVKRLEGDNESAASCILHESPSQRSNKSQDGCNETASIDTSSWVISPTHKYYFGCSPPSIPKAFVTHEVYPKPIEMTDDVDKRAKIVDEPHLGSALPSEKLDNWEIRPKMSFTMSELSLETSTVGGDLCTKYESHRSVVRSLDDLDESHGDASTIFDWTEPEKSQSFCCLSLENVAEVAEDETSGTEAAGDGSDLARIKGEISMDTLQDEPQGIPEESPSIPFSFKESNTSTGRCDERTAPSQRDNYVREINCGYKSLCIDDGIDKIKKAKGISDLEWFRANHSGPQGNMHTTDYVTKCEPNQAEDVMTESKVSCDELIDCLAESDCDLSSEKEESQMCLNKVGDPSVQEELDGNELKRSVNPAMPSIRDEDNTKLMMQQLQEEILKRYKHNREGEDETGLSSTSDDENQSDKSEVDLLTEENNFVEGISNMIRTDNDNAPAACNKIDISEHIDETLVSKPMKEPKDTQVPRDDSLINRFLRQPSPKKSVDNFKSADDISRPLQALNSGDLTGAKKAKGESNGSIRGLHDKFDCSSKNNGNAASKELRNDRQGHRPVKRNDMVTLTIVALALGLGTLGYMTSVGGGNTHVFADLVAPTGGKVLNFIEQYIYATLPRTQRGIPIVLGGDPKGNNFLYTNGNSVIIRNIHDPAISDIYTEHSCPVNVAKYSPSGFYIASGDQSGKIRIWDTVNKEHLMKNEFQPIAGPIKDISWSPDNQRMVAVGEGRERFGHVFMSETGTSVGEIAGQSKSINSCDFRPARPFRIITGSEDNTIGVFEGPPFKFVMTKKDHARFVQAVRYSPNGELFASAGFDGKVFLYDGKTSDLISEIGSPAHKGGVYGVAWKPDGTQLLTASGDKTCKLWDVETKTVVSEFNMGNAVEDQQVSCLWQGQYLLSAGLSGFISYLDVNNPDKPIRVIKGHNKPITVLASSPDRQIIYTGSHDGNITAWNAKNGENDRIEGIGHGNQINGMKCSNASEYMYTCGIDDSLKQINVASKSYTGVDFKLGSQPRGMDLQGNVIIAATVKEIIVLDGTKKLSTLPVNYEPSSVSINGDEKFVAVGGAMDNKVHVYNLNGTSLNEKCVCEHLGPVTDCTFSPDGNYLVASDANRKVILYKVPEFELAHNKEWGFHNARVNCVAWSPNSQQVASGSLDTTIIIWSVLFPAKHTIIKNAHPQSQITRLLWLDDETLVSVGQDCNTKIWNIVPIS